MKRYLFNVLFYFLSAAYSTAATYYVSPSGNNTSNGLSIPTAFKTLQYASNKVIAGDSVIVLAGTYTGFYHTTSGTAANPIVFFAQPGVLINQPNGTTNDGINLEGASYVTIEGFKVYGVPRAGIRSVLNDHVVIKNNAADSNRYWGILTGFSDSILIENNECSRSVIEHGIYFSNSADYPVIRNNKSWGNNANGIHMNGDVSLGGDGIISYALVENNIIWENGKAGGSGINCDGVQNSRIQNNLLYSNHASGISLYKIDGGDGAKNNVVVNNTIVQASDGRWAINISDGSTGNIIFNNILYHSHAFRGSISVDAASMSGLVSDYNVTINKFSTDGGNTVITLAQWRTATGGDANTVTSTPAVLFVNSAAKDYHLSATSPARDKGIASLSTKPAPVKDIESVIRPQASSHDAGCYEYVAATGIVDAPVLFSELDENATVHVYDLQGKMIFTGKKISFGSERLTFPTGLYIFVSIDDRGNTQCGKIIVSN